MDAVGRMMILDEVSFSGTVTDTVVQNERLTWVVNRYSLCPDILHSPTYHHQWHLTLHRITQHSTYITLHLLRNFNHRHSQLESTHCACFFAIARNNGRNNAADITLEATATVCYENGQREVSLPSHGFKTIGKAGGAYGEFLLDLIDPISEEKYDSFEIAVDLSILSEPTSVTYDSTASLYPSIANGSLVKMNAADPKDPLLDYLTELEIGRDFVLFSSDFERFPVHACILATRSDVLKTMLLSPMVKNAQNQIRLPTPGAVVKEFLNYMYTGRCSLKGIEEPLLELAHMYQVKDLMNLCEISILETMDPSTAVRVLKVAKLYEVETLYLACLHQVAFNWPTISEDTQSMEILGSDVEILNDVLNSVNELKSAKSPGTKRKRSSLVS